MWHANSALFFLHLLFIYISTLCVETVKWLDYNHYSQLTRWCSSNESTFGARGPGFNSRLRNGFLCLIFCYVGDVFLLFLSKTHYFLQNVAISFAILIYLVYVTYCKICDRVLGYTRRCFVCILGPELYI